MCVCFNTHQPTRTQLRARQHNAGSTPAMAQTRRPDSLPAILSHRQTRPAKQVSGMEVHWPPGAASRPRVGCAETHARTRARACSLALGTLPPAASVGPTATGWPPTHGSPQPPSHRVRPIAPSAAAGETSHPRHIQRQSIQSGVSHTTSAKLLPPRQRSTGGGAHDSLCHSKVAGWRWPPGVQATWLPTAAAAAAKQYRAAPLHALWLTRHTSHARTHSCCPVARRHQ
jgi:hypothetical protein